MSFLKKLFGSAPKLMDWREFTQYFVDTARREHGLELSVDWGEDIDNSTVLVPMAESEEQGRCYLGNAYLAYCRAPEDVDDIVARTLVPLVQMSSGTSALDEALRPEQILPVLKHVEYMQQIHEMYRKDGKDPAQHVCEQPLAGDVMLTYMVDSDEVMRTFGRDELASVDIHDDGALYHTALDNLRRLLDEGAQLQRHPDHSLSQLLLDGTYDASLLLLLPELLPQTDIRLSGDLVAAVPARDTLLFCSSDDAAALAYMRDYVAEAMQSSPYLISEHLFVWQNGAWSVYRAH